MTDEYSHWTQAMFFAYWRHMGLGVSEAAKAAGQPNTPPARFYDMSQRVDDLRRIVSTVEEAVDLLNSTEDMIVEAREKLALLRPAQQAQEVNLRILIDLYDE